MAEFNGVVNKTAELAAMNEKAASEEVIGKDLDGSGVIEASEKRAAQEERDRLERGAVIPKDVVSLLVGITPDKLANATIMLGYEAAAGVVAGAQALVKGEVRPPETPNTPNMSGKSSDRSK